MKNWQNPLSWTSWKNQLTESPSLTVNGHLHSLQEKILNYREFSSRSYQNALRMILVISAGILFNGCAAKKPYYSRDDLQGQESVAQNKIIISKDNIEYEVFVTGDLMAESQPLGKSPVIRAIRKQLEPNSKNQSIIFLGNTFGPSGIPSEEEANYQEIYSDTKNCLSELNQMTDRLLMIPGNQEWFDGTSYTVNAIQDFEELIEDMMDEDNILYPEGGCGEPKVIELTDQLLLIIIDSQWLLQGDYSEERKRSGCEIDDEIEFITALKEILSDNKEKNILIAGHHPVYSNGLTGGNYPARSHFIPLPVLGTIFTGAKILLGSEQQFGHPRYEAYRSAILTALADYDGIAMVSAHDHNLQYFEKSNNHFVIAGGGYISDFVKKGGDASFAYKTKGFAKITITKNKEVWLQFYSVQIDQSPAVELVFSKRLKINENRKISQTAAYQDPDSFPSTKLVRASDLYSKKIIGMGDMYRKEWGTEVELPVLILDEVDGGLIPVKQGGGFQTRSLRLENPDGRQYVLRSVDKESTKSIPLPLRNTFIHQIIQDGIAATHPYGALTIPVLAEEAGLYHTNPKIVWLPAQQALGEYNTDFAGKLYLFEERPGGNTKGHPSFGGTEETANTLEMIQKLEKNHKHRADQKMFLRARLFDILVGDWDRHEDQWRWGIFEDPENPEFKIYKPIPRDRDQVFFRNDGFFNYMVSRSWFNPKLQKFDVDIKNLPGLVKNGGHLDRIVLSQMTKEDFVNAAKFLKNQITDSIIEESIRALPNEIRNISGADIAYKLKRRRDKLEQFAEEFYYHLSKEITVVGTDNKNIFEIQVLPDDKLNVEVYHLNGDDEKFLIWKRVILGSETDELRIYGLKKSDEFNFHGDHESSIKIRFVGGGGKDTVNNQSRHNDILVYDKPYGISLEGNPVKSKMADRRGINRYDRTDWKLNRFFQFPMLSFYTDEGIGISYNIWWNTFGFRSDPYKSIHALRVAYFQSNSAIILNYSGHWPNALGYDWDFRLDATGKGPAFTQYFYGLGNEFINYENVFPDIDDAGKSSFHIVKGIQTKINPAFVKNLINGQSVSIVPSFELLNLSNEPDEEPKFIFSDAASIPANGFGSKLYGSLGIYYNSTRLNHPIIPTRGFDFVIGAEYRQSLRDSDFSNVTLRSNTSAYIPFSPNHSTVLAMNFGGAYTFGDYEFFHANYLSSPSRLRGYKTNRFAGDGIVYHATDLRIQITEGNGPFRTSLGIFGAFDYGRAFYDDDIDDWHFSFGGGIFLTPLDLAGLKIGYYVGEDDRQLSIGGSMIF